MYALEAGKKLGEDGEGLRARRCIGSMDEIGPFINGCFGKPSLNPNIAITALAATV